MKRAGRNVKGHRGLSGKGMYAGDNKQKDKKKKGPRHSGGMGY